MELGGNADERGDAARCDDAGRQAKVTAGQIQHRLRLPRRNGIETFFKSVGGLFCKSDNSAARRCRRAQRAVDNSAMMACSGTKSIR